MENWYYHIFFSEQSAKHFEEVFSIVHKNFPGTLITKEYFKNYLAKNGEYSLGSIANKEDATKFVRSICDLGTLCYWVYAPDRTSDFRYYKTSFAPQKRTVFTYSVYIKGAVADDSASKLLDDLKPWIVLKKLDQNQIRKSITSQEKSKYRFLINVCDVKEANELLGIIGKHCEKCFYVLADEKGKLLFEFGDPGSIAHIYSASKDDGHIGKEMVSKYEDYERDKKLDLSLGEDIAFDENQDAKNVKRPEFCSATSCVVGQSERIEKLMTLLKYAPNKDSLGYSKSDILRAFLSMVIADEKTYKQSASSKNILEPSTGENDWELNGYDLFKKYIGYELGHFEKTACLPLNNLRSFLNPTESVYKYKENYNPLDQLIFAFAVRLHKTGFFSSAIAMYELYLAQQPNREKSLDCFFASFYIALAKNECLDVAEQKTSSSPLDSQPFRVKLRQINRSLNSNGIDKMADEIYDISCYQKDFHEYESEIRRIYDGRPDYNVDNIAALQKVVADINAHISKSNYQDVVRQLKDNFSPAIKQMDKTVNALILSKGVIDSYYSSGELSDEQLKERICATAGYDKKTTENTSRLNIAYDNLRNALQNDGPNKEARIAQVDRIKPFVDEQAEVTNSNRIAREKKDAEKLKRTIYEAEKRERDQKEKEARERFSNSSFGKVLYGIKTLVPTCIFPILLLVCGCSMPLYPSNDFYYENYDNILLWPFFGSVALGIIFYLTLLVIFITNCKNVWMFYQHKLSHTKMLVCKAQTTLCFVFFSSFTLAFVILLFLYSKVDVTAIIFTGMIGIPNLIVKIIERIGWNRQ